MSSRQNEPAPKGLITPVALDRHQMERLEAGLAALRARDRAVFLASCQEHMSYAAIARRHRCSVGKVRRTIARALVSLHQSVWPRE